MRERELRQYLTCSMCRQKIGTSGLPLFWRITVERFGIEMSAVKRQDGLGAMLGSTALAQVMGTDEEMTRPMMEKVTLSVCEKCAVSPTMVAHLAECTDVRSSAPGNIVMQNNNLPLNRDLEKSPLCSYQGYEFGARYPDSVCIDGRLWDADYCDSNGNLYDREEDVPCPMCRREDAIRWHAQQFGKGTYKERMKNARLLVADIINNRKTGRFPL